MTESERDRLIFMGLVALDEAQERARHGPIAEALAVRVVLATLYATCGRDRRSFYAFWRALIRPVDDAAWGQHDKIVRSNELHSSFCGIVRALGIANDIQLGDALALARRPPRPGAPRWFDKPAPLFARAAARARFAETLRRTADF